MAVLEERYAPGLSSKAALALALDCCRALQEGQPPAPPIGEEAAAGTEGKEAEAAAGGAAAGAVDVAIVSSEGVKLVERLSPPEALLSLAVADEAGEEGEGAGTEGERR